MIVISGASGFIGTYLLENIPFSQAISLRSNDWQNRLRESDVVINLVGKAHDHRGTAKERDYYYANLDLLKEIYNQFTKSSASLFIHVSSLAALEEYESNDYLDERSPCNPHSFYGKSKRDAEKWLLVQSIPEGKKVIILRPPMVHGPGDKGNMGLLYKLISKGIPYPLSAFNNSRSFISLDNFKFFINEIITKRELLVSGIYHISDDDPISTKEIIQVIKSVTNKKVPNIAVPKFFVYILAKIGDILPIPLNSKRLKKMTSNLLVSNVKIKTSLGIQKLPLSAKEGLEITIKSFNKAK